MTDLSRGARVRRGGRRPGWVLLTTLLVLAIGASSALVFTSKVELLKLAVILALWAAVVAAFVSVIYRRQSDVDQARARDLKLVYDLQLDREISARREYELTVESQLRRELASELRAQASDEVSELRAELAALRTNLEILFDAELSERPALESERKLRPRLQRMGPRRTRAPASGSTGSRRCGPKSRPGAPTTRSSTCTRSRWSLLRQGSRPRRAISRRTPSSSNPPRRMQRRGKTGRRRRSRRRNQNAAPIGVRATTPDSRARGPRRQRHPRPHLRPSVRRKAKAGLHRNGNRSPAVGPRRGHRPPPGPSDSSHRSARDVHIGGLRRLRSLSRSSPRRQNRSRSSSRRPSRSSRRLRNPSPNSCRRRRPSRHSNSREFHGRRPRKSPASKSSRPGSRSAPRDSGCRPERPAATGTPARPTAPRRRRGPTTTRRHATGRRIVRRASANRLPRRSNDGDAIPADLPNRRRVRPAKPRPNGASRAVAHGPVIPRTSPTPASAGQPHRRRRCHRRRLRHRRRRRHRWTRGR